MTHTLVAAFDTLDEALAAKSELLTERVLESNIQISSSKAQAPAAGDTSSATHEDDESLGHKISHFFSNLFGNDDDHKPHRYAVAYPEAYRRGATLLTVVATTELEAENIEDILERNGAFDIDERSATWETDDLGSEPDAGVTHIAGTHVAADRADIVDRSFDNDAASTPIPVIEENLRVGKREVNKGRVRVVSRVSERPVEETVSLHEEHAHIERRPVDRPAADDELNSFKAGSIEIQETAEEVVIEKSARVVEEVTVGKQSSDRQETVRDTVRRTDVEVQSEPASTVKPGTLGTDSNSGRKI
jgi:uncharacterized protein (TIGR02271 family)